MREALRKEKNMETQAHIHSLQGRLDKVAIVQHEDNNHVVAEYRGNLYTAVYNPYVGAYYVDDVYGCIRKRDRVTKETER